MTDITQDGTAQEERRKVAVALLDVIAVQLIFTLRGVEFQKPRRRFSDCIFFFSSAQPPSTTEDVDDNSNEPISFSIPLLIYGLHLSGFWVNLHFSIIGSHIIHGGALFIPG